MKLEEVQVRDKVPTGAPGDHTNRLEAGRGWSLSFEAGIVTAENDRTALLIPVGNVVYMRQAKAEAKKPVRAA